MFRKSIAYCGIKMMNPDSLKYMRKGYRLFYGTGKEMKKFQDFRYQKLLLYAYTHIEYYHSVFDKIGLIQNGRIKKERCEDIPILTKDIIRREGDRLISDEAEKRGIYYNTSGGSTGESVSFVQDKEYFSHNFGDKLLFGILNGKEPGEKEIKLWGSERDILQGTIGIKEKCINWCYNRIFLNSFVLDDVRIQNYIDIINTERPKQIWTYVDSVYQMARYINETGQKVYAPENIITTAGVLYDAMREEISRAFKESKILNQYGSREVGLIGCEIGKKRGIRIFDHSVKAEVLDTSSGKICRSGKGELIITNLNNYSMPLIRYRIGDVGEIACGQNGFQGSYSVLSGLTGRTNTHLKREDGGIVHGEYVTHLFYNKEWIRNFRVIQHGYKDIEFQIVRKEGYRENDRDLRRMKQELNRVIPDCKVSISYFENIPKLKSGKYQFVISEIQGADK